MLSLIGVFWVWKQYSWQTPQLACWSKVMSLLLHSQGVFKCLSKPFGNCRHHLLWKLQYNLDSNDPRSHSRCWYNLFLKFDSPWLALVEDLEECLWDLQELNKVLSVGIIAKIDIEKDRLGHFHFAFIFSNSILLSRILQEWFLQFSFDHKGSELTR